MVEVLSPSTASKDMKDKFELYEENQVKEYWVVYPGEQMVEVYKIEENGKYGAPTKFLGPDSITSQVLPGFNVTAGELFEL